MIIDFVTIPKHNQIDLKLKAFNLQLLSNVETKVCVIEPCEEKKDF